MSSSEHELHVIHREDAHANVWTKWGMLCGWNLHPVQKSDVTPTVCESAKCIFRPLGMRPQNPAIFIRVTPVTWFDFVWVMATGGSYFAVKIICDTFIERRPHKHIYISYKPHTHERIRRGSSDHYFLLVLQKKRFGKCVSYILGNMRMSHRICFRWF